MDGVAGSGGITEDANDSLKELPSQRHDASPGLSKHFNNLSLNVSAAATATSPDRRPSASTPKSPRSPTLNRKTSSSSLRPQSRPQSRHASSAATAPVVEERPPLTPASVAADFFRKELVYHIGTDHTTDTLVIAHDSCYGHRFSRPKTSKTNLSLIFERPERLQAGALGLAHAYVRLGQRHVGGIAPPHPHRDPHPALPFRIQKTQRALPVTSPYVTAVHGTKWMQELKVMCDGAQTRLAAGEKELKRPDTPTNDTSKPYLHEGDLYLCGQSLDAFEGALGGVCEAVDAVFLESGNYQPHKKAFVCIRPPGHHCSADLPSGFCWINNVHVGIEYAAQNHGLTHAAIIDFDLHHGDGSQAIAWERNAKSFKLQAQKPTAKNAANKKTFIGYFSLHDINSYPCEDGDIDKVQRASVCIDNAHGQSIWNVHLQPYADEAEFWRLYETRYLVLLEKTRNFLRLHSERLRAVPGAPPPKAAIFISAGFDASQWETPSMQRHRVSVPTEFYARFTSDIVKLAEEEGCSCDGRVISVLEGGYSDRALNSGVLSHVAGLSNPRNILPPPQPRFTPTPGEGMDTEKARNAWNTAWWSEQTLTELENMLKPQPPPAPPKRPPRSNEPHSYQSPTQAFTAKAVDPEKVKRTFSASHKMPTPPRTRPPTPPPPDVDWATASHELSKLLIPSDRQVDSCKHEELNEPRQKRERHSSIGIASVQDRPVVGDRMTRGRKAKATVAEEADDAHRRQTVSTVPVGDASSISGSNSAARSRSASKARQPSSSGSSDVLKVNKTRRSSASRDDTSSSTTMPAPPVPRVPKQHAARPPSRAGTDKSKTTQTTSNVSRPPSRTGVDQTGDAVDVDSLTSGVKKITLKLSKEDEKAAASAGAKKPPKKPAAPRKSAASKATAAKNNEKAPSQAAPEPVVNAGSTIVASPTTELPPSTLDGAADIVTSPTVDVLPSELALAPTTEHVKIEEGGGPQSELSTSISAPAAQASTDTTANSVAMHDVVTPSTEAPSDTKSVSSVTTTSSVPSVPASSANPSFVPYNPPGQPMRSASTQERDLTWMPPNHNTPVHLAGKKSLPVFTSKSHIPFALPPGGKRQSLTQSSQPSSIPVPKAASVAPTEAREAQVQSNITTADVEAKPQEPAPSVWDVPTTPGQ